jgi:hypothetical protein
MRILTDEKFQRAVRVREGAPQVAVHRRHIISVIEECLSESMRKLLHGREISPLHHLNYSVGSGSFALPKNYESRDECRATRADNRFINLTGTGEVELNYVCFHFTTTTELLDYSELPDLV